MIPDPEKILGDYLRPQLELPVITDPAPRSIEGPWVRLTLLDDRPTDNGVVGRSYACYMQIDCFAGKSGGLAEAREAAILIREALSTPQVVDQTTISGADLSMSRQPDTSFEPQMERFIVTGTVWMHE